MKVTEGPTITRDETSHYTMLLQDGKAWQFYYPQDVKSVIARPSPGLTMKGPRFYQVSGLAWVGSPRSKSPPMAARAGRGGIAAAGAPDCGDPLPHGLALGWRIGHAAKPRDG
jgi:sulfane dehydrogenase subunit SoxC